MTIFSKRIQEKMHAEGDSAENSGKRQIIENLFNAIKEIQEKKPKIVLPEPEDERALTAAEIANEMGIATIILVGNPKNIEEKAKKLNIKLDGLQIIEPKSFEDLPALESLLVELRKHKGMDLEKAKKKVLDPITFGALMVKSGKADGMVAGATHETSDVLRTAFTIVKPIEGVSTISGAFVMVVPNNNFGEKFSRRSVFLFADCAVTIDPTADQLADIAYCSSKTMKTLLGIDPKIAMLSYSTYSGKRAKATSKMLVAKEILEKKYPELKLEAEVQLDAAIIPDVSQRKNPDSKLKGEANVLIFPNLSSGNIGYKLVQRLANAEAIGPILQGLSKPINDLSRGCSVEDIVNLIAITSYQAVKQASRKSSSKGSKPLN